MSDDEQQAKPLAIERAKQGRAKCQKCKEKIDAGALRFAKLNFNNPFGSAPLKQWFHIDCFCENKSNKAKIALSSADDIDGWDLISSDDKKQAIDLFGPDFKVTSDKSPVKSSPTKDNLFSEFNSLIDKVASEPSYNTKSAIIQRYLREGSNSKKFEGSLETWLKLLTPKIDQRVYNLRDKQIVKLFSRIFNLKHDELLLDLHAGDVSETISKFFKLSKNVKPAAKSSLTVLEIDKFLDDLSTRTLENDQIEIFEEISEKCSTNDLRTLIRLIKKDLKMNCRERHVLDAIHPDAYDTFQKSRDLKKILHLYGTKSAQKSSKSSDIQVMTPIAPMLAEACKDFDKALAKCRDGFYSEIKYDGERVQIHKKGDDFKFFSRNLKPVQEHKIAKIKEYLPRAFPAGNDLILDSEVIMVDTETDALLPFGTLGKHKKQELQNASTCLFVFDCLSFNDHDLTKKSLKERKEFLEMNMQPIKHHIELSEYKLLRTKNELVEMTKDVLKKGLEGLVLKGVETCYEPGKRRWLKVKKDYLLEGSIADSADLVVLGAYYGTGKMGSRFSIFLMGCFDDDLKVWKTVTKVHSGLDDATMEKMHKKLDPLMDRFKKLPEWIQIDKSLFPDAITKDPLKMPVFEVVAAEFTNSDVHTANSISMRFPRIAKIRDDKSAVEATTLSELLHLFEESKSGIHIDELNRLKSDSQKATVDDDGKSLAAENKDLRAKDKDLKSSKHFKPESKDLKSPTKEPKSESQKPKSESKEPKTAAENSKTPSTDPNLPAADLKRKKSEDESQKSSKKVKFDENLFEGLIMLDNEALGTAERDDFKSHGGKLTKTSLKANLVLHNEAEIHGELEEMRRSYSVSCKHYQKEWLMVSLRDRKLVDPLKYFVRLKQS